jgi:hypothetical protein
MVAEEIRRQVLRIDDFTASSLVSHAANVKPEKLQQIDLLPRMKDKIVIVKEMAPIFTGNEDDLVKKFGVFASILDGQGYMSSSGIHGMRGYNEKIVFTLIGAVTPAVLNLKVHKALTSVGPRFCFWDLPERKIDENWRGPKESWLAKEQGTVQTVARFLEGVLKQNEPGSIPRSDFMVPAKVEDLLSSIAVLMAKLRSSIIVERSEDDPNPLFVPSMESPERAYRYLEQLAFGSALLEDRRELLVSDLKIPLGIALGSGSPVRKRAFRVFFDYPGDYKTAVLGEALRVSFETAEKHAFQLERLGLIETVHFSGTRIWGLTPQFKRLQAEFVGAHPQFEG